MFQTKPIKKQLKNGQQPTKIIRKNMIRPKKRLEARKNYKKRLKHEAKQKTVSPSVKL
jgi:hypothetical protein